MSHDRIRRYIGEHAYSCLDSIIKGVNPTLPEKAFRDRYVHVLFMRLDSLDNKAGNVWIAEVAKNGRQPVDIVNEQGEVLFTVPGIDATVASNRPEGRSLSDIMVEAQRLQQSSYARRSEEVKQKGLNKYFNVQKKNPEIAIWAKIFARYGLLKAPTASTTVMDTTPNLSQFDGVEDDF